MTLLEGGDGDSLSVDASGAGSVLISSEASVDARSGLKSGTGHVTILAGLNVLQGPSGDITTSGTGSVNVGAGGGITMETGASTVAGGVGAVRYLATGDVQLGTVDAGTGQASIISVAGSVLDNSDTASVVSSSGLRIEAGVGVGMIGAGNGAPGNRLGGHERARGCGWNQPRRVHRCGRGRAWSPCSIRPGRGSPPRCRPCWDPWGSILSRGRFPRRISNRPGPSFSRYRGP